MMKMSENDASLVSLDKLYQKRPTRRLQLQRSELTVVRLIRRKPTDWQRKDAERCGVATIVCDEM
jgi:hypothetical protein